MQRIVVLCNMMQNKIFQAILDPSTNNKSAVISRDKKLLWRHLRMLPKTTAKAARQPDATVDE